MPRWLFNAVAGMSAALLLVFVLAWLLARPVVLRSLPTLFQPYLVFPTNPTRSYVCIGKHWGISLERRDLPYAPARRVRSIYAAGAEEFHETFDEAAISVMTSQPERWFPPARHASMRFWVTTQSGG